MVITFKIQFNSDCFFVFHFQDSLFAENEKLKVYLAKIQKEFKAALPSGGNEVPCQGGANGNDLITVLTQENEELKRMIKEFEKKIRHQHSARAVSDLRVLFGFINGLE